MVPAPFIVVVDANVLFPLTLRDTVLRAAAAGFYQLRWSAQILDEMELRQQPAGLVEAPAAFDELLQRLEGVVPELVAVVRHVRHQPGSRSR
jgi:hypothetical protein